MLPLPVPAVLAKSDFFDRAFQLKSAVIGDDIKSQHGATIVNCVLGHLFRKRQREARSPSIGSIPNRSPWSPMTMSFGR